MAYVELSDVEGKIPSKFLIQALDDDNDGAIDTGIFELVQAQAGQEIDGRLGQRYEVPFVSPLPALVSLAALIFACEGVYARRVVPDQNPFKAQADGMRSKLDEIAKGEQPLTPEIQRKQPSVSVITSPSRTFSSSRTAL